MTVLLSVALLCAALLIVGWRIERVLKARADRQLAIEERKVALEEARVKPREQDIPIPKGLLMIAANETESWANEQLKQRMRELFAETGDWNVVGDLIIQEAHGILPRPES